MTTYKKRYGNSMKKITAVLTGTILMITLALSVSAQASDDTTARDFYQELEKVIADSAAQDPGNDQADISDGFPGLADPVFMYREGDAEYDLNEAIADPGNGIILQMADGSDPADENAEPADFIAEEEGFPWQAFSEPVKPDEEQPDMPEPAPAPEPAGCTVSLNISNGGYEGDIYNATGYYSRTADTLKVNIAQDAQLTGDIALTSYVHGIMLGELSADDIISAVNSVNQVTAGQDPLNEDDRIMEYAFIDASGNVTGNSEDAYAVQFTKFPVSAQYLSDQVINSLNYNGKAGLEVYVDGTWTIRSASLITYLEIAEGAYVYGELIELADGSMMIIASEKQIEPGKYGKTA